MSWRRKLESAEDAAARVGRRDTLAVPLGPGQPPAFLHALGERDDFEELVVFGALLVDLFRVFARPGVQLRSGFFGPVERGLVGAGHDVQFVPSDFRGFEQIAARMRPRVMATAATPPDAEGRMSLSLHAGATVDELRRCGRDPERLLVVEVNSRLPRTRGLPPDFPHALTVQEADVIVEADRELLALPDPEPTPVDRAIACNALPFVESGATLQTGIGAVPGEIAELLCHEPGGDYGVHSEMFTNGLMRLHRAGKVSNEKKGLYDGVSVATFALGTRELYDWLDGEDRVCFLPVSQVNDPAQIARNDRFLSINGALAVDLLGQVAADRIGGRQHSGIGGHLDFVTGAVFSPGGRSLLCLPSTAQVGGRRVSRIVAELGAGASVTAPRHEIDVVVTDQGAAELAGLSVAERAEALVELAHPDFRDELQAARRRL